jgi:hypothetical protein
MMKTLLVNEQQVIFNAMGVRSTRGIVAVALAFDCRMYACFGARFCINQQSLMNALHQVGEGMLTSCSLLTRPARQALCQTFSVVERLDPRYAQAYYRRAQ